MEQQPVNYSKMLPAFKRSAGMMLTEHLPGHFKAARSLINSTLKKEHPKLRRWYNALKKGVLTIEEFIRLFTSLRNAFRLKELEKRGVPAEKAGNMGQLISKLFRAMVICMSGAVQEKPVNQLNSQI